MTVAVRVAAVMKTTIVVLTAVAFAMQGYGDRLFPSV